MKISNHIILIFITCFISISGHSQNNNKKYWFQMDYAAEKIINDLDSLGIDTILTSFYHLDNGRGSNATKIIFWKKNGETFVNAVRLKKIDKFKVFGQSKLPSDSIFQFFFDNRLDTVTSNPKSELSISHNFGYSVDFKYGSSKYNLYLRNEKRSYDPTHLKSMWIEMIDRVGRKYYE